MKGKDNQDRIIALNDVYQSSQHKGKSLLLNNSLRLNAIIIFNFFESMYSQASLSTLILNQQLINLRTTYEFLRMKQQQKLNSQTSPDLSLLFSYAVSMGFKKFQHQFESKRQSKPSDSTDEKAKIAQTEAIAVSDQKTSKVEKNKKDNQKLEKSIFAQASKINVQEVPATEKKLKSHSELPTEADDSEEIQRIENKKVPVEKQKKKAKNLQKQIKVDLIDFAQVKAPQIDKDQISERKNSLLSRMVTNWSQTQKSRRNEKLELRRIKY